MALRVGLKLPVTLISALGKAQSNDDSCKPFAKTKFSPGKQNLLPSLQTAARVKAQPFKPFKALILKLNIVPFSNAFYLVKTKMYGGIFLPLY